jgi:hypothetical protein
LILGFKCSPISCASIEVVDLIYYASVVCSLRYIELIPMIVDEFNWVEALELRMPEKISGFFFGSDPNYLSFDVWR